MLIKRWYKTRNCYVYDIRLIDENGKKRLFTTGHTSKKVAREREHELRNEIALKKMYPERFAKRILLKDFIKNEYLTKHASRLRSYRDYVSLCNNLIKHFGHLHLDEITRYLIESYQAKRSNEVGTCMENREVTILKGIFTKAIDWEFYHGKNPAKGIKLKKEKPRERFLKQEEIYKLIESCGKERMAPYLKSVVIIALFTGLRKSELLRLKREHIYLDQNIIKVEDGKGGYTRYVPMYPTARKEIAKLLLKGKSEYLIHDKKGNPFEDVKKSFNSAVRRAGLHDVHFHDLRRTFATLGALYAHVEEKDMQMLLGHASIVTTMKHYVMSTKESKEEAIKRTGNVLDSYMDTSKKEATKDMAQSVGIIGGAEGD